MAQNSPLAQAPLQGTPLQQAPRTPQPPATKSFMDQLLSTASARYDAVKKEFDQIARVRGGVDKLLAKGDAVTQEDVLEEMSELVARGADPKMFAAMMAGNSEVGVGPMPPTGEPLARWLAGVESTLLAPYEAQLAPALALSRHQLGVAAVHAMVGVHGDMQRGAQPPVQNAPTTPLLQ